MGSSPADVAKDADVVLSMVPNSPHVLDVYLGESGVLKTLPKDALCVDSSTIQPSVAREVCQAVEEAGAFFDMNGFKPAVLRPGETRALAQIVLRREAWKTRLLDSRLTLKTNVSDIVVPLLCFHGKLSPVSCKTSD